MISNSDFEKAWFLYKTEYEPKNISINDFCIRKGLPYTEFNKWFRKTHKRIVPVEVEGMPVASDDEQQIAGKPSQSVKSKNGGIHVFIRTHDGLQIQKKGISYQDLVSLVEKLEGLC